MTTMTFPNHTSESEGVGGPLVLAGKPAAAVIREKCIADVNSLRERYKVLPGLAVLLVGDNPASLSYVNAIERSFSSAGLNVSTVVLPGDCSRAAFQAELSRLSTLREVAGIIVEQPLPAHLHLEDVINVLDPNKDIDGIHPENIGRLALGLDGYVPATPAGGMALLDHYGIPVEGKQALVIGRSSVVGKPMAQLLLARNATVTVAHSRTGNLDELIAGADVVAAAVGKPGFVKGKFIKHGAIVIDFGTSVVDGRLKGDVEYDVAAERARAITPVPGGAGPMTNAMLLKNTVKAIRRCLSATS